MIFFINKIALSLYLVSFALFCSADVTTITLKSARAVKAEITEQPSLKAIQVAVQFLPVTSLDALNNEKMNSVIARFFVEDALSQFYKKGKTVNFTFLKPIIEKTTTQKKRYVYLVPFTAISDIVVKTKKTGSKSEYNKIFADDIFLTPTELFSRDLKLVENFFLSQIQTQKKHKNLEKNINKALNEMKEKINSQDDLLSAEKDEFVEKIEKVRTYLIKKISQHLNLQKKTTESEYNLAKFISQYYFRADFKEILVSDPALLEYGGCKAFRLPDGKIALIGVGFSEIKNNSPKERLLRKKIAEHRAFSALAEHRSVEVSTFSKFSESAAIKTINKQDEGEDYRSLSTVSTVKSEAYFEKMETVGYWYSKDGQLFFLAKGCFIK